MILFYSGILRGHVLRYSFAPLGERVASNAVRARERLNEHESAKFQERLAHFRNKKRLYEKKIVKLSASVFVFSYL